MVQHTARKDSDETAAMPWQGSHAWCSMYPSQHHGKGPLLAPLLTCACAPSLAKHRQLHPRRKPAACLLATPALLPLYSSSHALLDRLPCTTLSATIFPIYSTKNLRQCMVGPSNKRRVFIAAANCHSGPDHSQLQGTLLRAREAANHRALQ